MACQRHPIIEGESMNTQELLQLMRLLAALESWAFAQGKMLPDYMHDDLCKAVNMIEREILKGQK
jgi:hypothetical protein